MGWHGQLTLNYRHEAPRTLVHDRHEGPLRVLASLYPEGPGICHNVLVHPPGGIVGGDQLHLTVDVASQAHALITTPGATRLYRSAGETAEQHLVARVAAQARLEWLPLETMAYNGTRAINHLRFELAPGAEMMGWDVLALGLPASEQSFVQGRFEQQIELPGLWLERGILDAAHPHTRQLLASPLGWDGQCVLATMWWAAGQALDRPRRERLIDAARHCVEDSALLRDHSGVTSPDERLIVLRALAPRTEPALALLKSTWSAWRAIGWQLEACPPRVWNT
ncbi:MAG: urease accessory protein UreD [Caldimonas sp.]|nr:MAG: urease accessory protein UreD [Caldimonas sp.]